MLKDITKSIMSRFGYVIKRRRTGIERSAIAPIDEIDPANLMKALHVTNIYEGFDYVAVGNNLQGWGSDSKTFSTLIAEIKPKFIIEVGTWKGGSAIMMAKELSKLGTGVVLCIDTWLGAIEFWNDHSDPNRYLSLKCKHGFPQVYYTFLANVCHAGMQNYIVPFPLHSSSAALWLMTHGLKADMIYVDASHEEDDVYQDMLDYYALVKPGGVLFGDDWTWVSVRSAVTRFASENKVAISHLDDKWVIKKANKASVQKLC